MNELKTVSSHQPHFFPWLGYFDKMAKADLFLLNDVAQFEVHSPMHRNKVLARSGKEQFINVIVDKTDYLNKKNGELLLKEWDSTRSRIIGIVRDCYKNSAHYSEIWPLFERLILDNYLLLIDLNAATIELGRQILDIDTPIVRHSELIYDEGADVSERLAEKLFSINTDIYISGNGAKKYMNIEDFNKRNITVTYQSFTYPVYTQVSSSVFIPNLSFLDFAFNVGMAKGRELFWENVRNADDYIYIQSKKMTI